MNWPNISLILVTHGVPLAALVLSLLSFLDSRKARRFQGRLNQLEEKLKIHELAEVERQIEQAGKATVEARITRVTNKAYRMKIWNSGKATAYNVDFKVPHELENLVMRDKVPYEYLESHKSFEENIIVYDGIPRKFTVATQWTDNYGNLFSKEQIVTI